MPRIRPQSNNIKIKVSTQQTDDTVNVSTTNGTNPVKASNNMAEYWSNKSKEWAISENIVDNTDHSSKYYAGQAKEAYDGIDELVNGFEQTVEDATTNSIEEITESKDDAIADIIIEGGNQVNLVETTGGDLITQMTSLKDTTLGYKNDAQSSANSASVSETNAHTYETNALSYSNSASGSASIATQKATEAASSAINASESELNALAYSNSASTSALSASTSESNASTSETNAQTYANNANTSATNAATSEDNANIWAEGSDAEVQALGGVHSSKGWAEESASGQVQSDYTESDNTKKSYIKNKPDLTVFVQKNGGSSTQTISLTSGTGTTALGIKSMATSSYISLSGSNGWLGSYGVSSSKRAVFYNGTGYTLAYTSEIPTNTSELTNDSGYITGIGSSDVITALGYIPYNSTNPDNYTSNVGTVTSVNGIQPDTNGNVTIQAGGATDVQINSTSVTNQGVANILTQTAYDATSNKIATMSDLPTDKIFIATYGTTTFNEVWTAYDAGRTVFVKDDTTTTPASAFSGILAILNYFEFNSALDAHFEFASSILNDGTYYTYTLDQDSTWDEYTEQIPDTSGFEQTSNKVTSISSSSTNTQYPSAKLLYDQLALKQSTSTAVTHTANTAVGSSTTPVYINSSGVATSTGLSIASSRFDGQWVYKFLSGSSATAVGTVTIDLSSYLPSDSYKYEVLINLCLYSNPSSGGTDVFLWSDVFQNTNTGQDERVARCNANSRASENRFTMPVGTGRWIKRQIVDKAATVSCNVSFWGYRRIGTNT